MSSRLQSIKISYDHDTDKYCCYACLGFKFARTRDYLVCPTVLSRGLIDMACCCTSRIVSSVEVRVTDKQINVFDNRKQDIVATNELCTLGELCSRMCDRCYVVHDCAEFN